MPRIPQGYCYHGILFGLGGTAFTKSNITRIKLRLGGKLIWDLTGDELDTINKYLGMTANAAYLLLPFSELNSKTILGESIGAIDTASIQYSSFSLEVTIGAATAPTLTAWALVTDIKVTDAPEHIPLIKSFISSTHNKAAAGKYNLPIPVGSALGGLIKRVHLFHTNLTAFDVKMNGLDIQDLGQIGVEQFWQNNLTRVTQAGHLAFDPLSRDNQSDALPTLDAGGKEINFLWNATFSAADTVAALTEMYTLVQNM